jgi:hypothetical protein
MVEGVYASKNQVVSLDTHTAVCTTMIAPDMQPLVTQQQAGGSPRSTVARTLALPARFR